MGLCRFVQGLQDYACLAGDLSRLHIESSYRVHPAKGKDDGFPAFIGRRTAGHSAVATLGYDGDTVYAAKFDEGGNILRRGRRGKTQRLPGETTSPVCQPWCHEFGVAGPSPRAQQICCGLCETVCLSHGRTVASILAVLQRRNEGLSHHSIHAGIQTQSPKRRSVASPSQVIYP